MLPASSVKVNTSPASRRVSRAATGGRPDRAGAFRVIALPDGKVSMRQVQTAGWYGTDWIGTDGLKPGEAVVVDT